MSFYFISFIFTFLVSFLCFKKNTHTSMPSNHAQFAGFITVSLLFFALSTSYHSASSSNPPSLTITQFLKAVVVLICGLLICYSRLYFHYHTLEQILVGVCVVLYIVLFFMFMFMYIHICLCIYI